MDQKSCVLNYFSYAKEKLLKIYFAGCLPFWEAVTCILIRRINKRNFSCDFELTFVS